MIRGFIPFTILNKFRDKKMLCFGNYIYSLPIAIA